MGGYPIGGETIPYPPAPYTLSGGMRYPVPLPPIPYGVEDHTLSPLSLYPIGRNAISYPPPPYTLSPPAG